MNITILCVGKLKEKYWRDAEAEYSKRLKRFVNLQITELKESLLPANASPADEAAVKEAEGEAILANLVCMNMSYPLRKLQQQPHHRF